MYLEAALGFDKAVLPVQLLLTSATEWRFRAILKTSCDH